MHIYIYIPMIFPLYSMKVSLKHHSTMACRFAFGVPRTLMSVTQGPPWRLGEVF